MRNNLLTLLCLTSLAASAQTVVTEGTTLSISPSATFYSAGDFTNNGTVLNNGSLNISGAWTNSGDYQAEDGAVTFNGTAEQTINHNAQSFAKLVLSGGGLKLFKADITIVGELSLQNGILSTDNGSKIILSDNAVVTGGFNNSYVQGTVHASGTGSKIFPIGTNGTYLPVILNNVTGASPVVSISVSEPNAVSAVNSELVSVSALRSWTLKRVSGTYSGSQITLPLVNETFVKDDNIVVAILGDDSRYHTLGRSAFNGTAATGSVTSDDLATVGTFTTAEVTSDLDKTVVVHNAVTPNGDGAHDFLEIVNIQYFPAAEITIVNRWGDKVFALQGYDNDMHGNRFNGDGNVGGAKPLADGTYYYVLDKHNGDKKMTGFLIIKR